MEHIQEKCVNVGREYLVQDFLPKNFEYKIKTCDVTEHSEQNIRFDIELRVNVESENGVKSFLGEFNTSSGCTFNIQSGRQDKRQNKRSRYRGYRKCCMNVAHCEDKENRQPGKNTNCEASLNFRLENASAEYKSVRKDREMFPLWVKIHFYHNHALNRAEYFKYLSASQDTKDIFIDMFQQGLTPSAAHGERRRQIKVEFPDTWPEVCADRSKLPSIFWVYSWHRRWLDKTVGSRDGLDAYERAEKMVKDFDNECKKEFPLGEAECYAKIAQSDSGETVIAIVDPFMRRVHETVPQSGELVLIDATSNLDRNDSKLFHLVCPSAIGALPLAEIITTREDANTISFGLEILKSVLPVNAFYGRGRELGPHVFMTDDSDAERNSLSTVWPQSVLLLCIFHVLQAQWTWLWDAKHCIAHADKATLLNLFRKVLYSETDGELSDRLEDLYADPVILKYPQYQKHLMKDTFPKMRSWNIARRIVDKLPTSNHNTNNLVECSFRFTKDTQFNRLKAFNLPDMLSLVLDKSEFYTNKCVDAANNVIESWLRNCHSRYVAKKAIIDPEKIIQIGPHSYLVPSETQEQVSYVVDMVSRCCSCPQGRLCGPCKHKIAVSESRNVPCFDVIPTKCPEMRQKYMYLGTGKKVSIDWFLPIQADAILPVDIPPVTIPPPEVSPDITQTEQVGLEVLTQQQEIHPDIVKVKLQTVLNKLGDRLASRIEHDPSGYDKALDILNKTVDRLPLTVDSALQKTLCSFGKTVTQVLYIFGNFKMN